MANFDELFTQRDWEDKGTFEILDKDGEKYISCLTLHKIGLIVGSNMYVTHKLNGRLFIGKHVFFYDGKSGRELKGTQMSNDYVDGPYFCEPMHVCDLKNNHALIALSKTFGFVDFENNYFIPEFKGFSEIRYFDRVKKAEITARVITNIITKQSYLADIKTGKLVYRVCRMDTENFEKIADHILIQDVKYKLPEKFTQILFVLSFRLGYVILYEYDKKMNAEMVKKYRTATPWPKSLFRSILD